MIRFSTESKPQKNIMSKIINDRYFNVDEKKKYEPKFVITEEKKTKEDYGLRKK